MSLFRNESLTMEKRLIKKISNLKLKPFTRYGKPIPKLSWYPINYNKKNGYGSYILKFKPGGKSPKHKHRGLEEFLVLKGSLKDSIVNYCVLLSEEKANEIRGLNRKASEHIFYFCESIIEFGWWKRHI